MDQIKIGKFISEELAEILGISDKTISKWERGNGFPEVSLLLPLCNELEISVNELLSGEKLEEVDYKKKAEENMVNLVREAQESKKKIILSLVIVGFALLASIPLFAVVDYLELNKAVEVVLIVIGVLILVGGCVIACVLDRDAGAFECPECKERFVPSMTEYVMSVHTITKRKLTCPKCGERKYCKHVLTK